MVKFEKGKRKKDKNEFMQIEKEGENLMKMGSLVAHLLIKVLKGDFFFLMG